MGFIYIFKIINNYMDIYNNIKDVCNSTSHKIIETFEEKKNQTKQNIGNMNIQNFYIMITILIIVAIIIPLIIIYIYTTPVLALLEVKLAKK